MTRQRGDRTDQLLSDVFEAEGRTAAPQRMLASVVAETAHTPQAARRPWDGWGVPREATSLTVAVVVVVLVVVVLSGVAGRLSSLGLPLGTRGPGATAAPAAIACANATGLGGEAPNLWVGCPGGAEPLGVGTGSPSIGQPIDRLGVPVVGGAGSWALGSGGVIEMDVPGLARTVAVSDAAILGVGAEAVWVGTVDDTVVRVDATAGTVTGTIEVGATPLAIVEAGGRVWIAADDGLLHSYDTATLAPGPTAEVGAAAARIGANGSAVYVLSQAEGVVTRVDLETGVVTSRRVTETTSAVALGELLVGDDGVWVTVGADLLALDPLTLLPAGDVRLPANPVGIVRDGDSAWTVAETGRVDRVPLP